MDGMRTNWLDWLSMVLVIIGALAWGVLGLTGLIDGRLNVVQQTVELVFLPAVAITVANFVYILVGLAGLYFIYTSYKIGRASRQTTRQTASGTERRTE